MWLDPPEIIDGEALPRDVDDHDLAGVVDAIFSDLLRQDQPGRKMTREEYREVYLKSPEWRAFRSLAIETGGRRCVDCGRRSEAKQLDVHHLTYARLGAELLADVVVVCRDCHDKRHEGGEAARASG